MVDFNPYREWLGVEAASDRPDYYQMLGLRPFEPDEDRIVHAADQRLNQVRKIRPGQHIEQWQRVLDELTEIRRCLTDLGRKQQYDDQLRRQQGLGGGLSAAVVPANPTKQDSDVQVSPVRNLLPPTAEELTRPAPESPKPGPSGGQATPGVAASAAGVTQPSPIPSSPATPAAPTGGAYGGAGYGNVPYGTGFGPVIPASYGPGAGGPPASAFPSPPGMSAPTSGQAPFGQGQIGQGHIGQGQIGQGQPTYPTTPQGQPGQQAYGQASPNYGVGMPGAPASGQPAYGVQQPAYGQGPFGVGQGQPHGYAQQFPAGQFPQGQAGAYGQTPPGYATPPSPAPQMPYGSGQTPYGGGQTPYGSGQAPWGAQPGSPGAPAGNWGGGSAASFGGPVAMGAAAPMALPVGRTVPGGNPMAPVSASPTGGPSSASFGSAGPAVADRSEPAPSVSSGTSSTAAILAGRRRSSRFTLIASIGGSVIGLGVLVMVLQAMKGDTPGTNGNAGESTAAATTTPNEASKGTGKPDAVVPAASVPATDTPNNLPEADEQPKPPAAPDMPKDEAKPPVAPMPEPTNPAQKPDKPADKPNNADEAVDWPAEPDKQPDQPKPPQPAPPKPRMPDTIADPRTDVPATPEAAVAEMTKELADAKAALVARNVQQAKIHLNIATSLASAPDHKAMVKRLETLAHFVDEFWKGVNDGIKGLSGVDELEVGELRVSIIEFGDNDITIRAGGRNLRYSLSDIPAGLAETLFERVREMKDPLNKMAKGAFRAVDKARDAEKARELFQAAQLVGGDVEDLLAVLEDTYDVKNPPVARAVPVKRHLPDQTAMTEATGALKAKFGKEIAAAKSPQQKYDLAKKLMEEAALPMDNEATRLALFNEARDQAANAHLAQLTVRIIDETEKWFEIDVLEMKFDALSKAAVRASPQASRDIALECLQLADQAEEAKRMDVADKAVRIAAGSARTSRDLDLAKRATERMKEIQKAAREAATEKPASEGDAKQDAAAAPAAGAKT